MAKVSITGDKEIDKKLSQLEPKVTKKYLRQSMRQEMKEVQKIAKAQSPKDTGLLRKNIKVRSSKRKRGSLGVSVVAGRAEYPSGQRVGQVAAAQEYGTSKVAPQPFMRTAYDQRKDDARDNILRTLRDKIEQEAK